MIVSPFYVPNAAYVAEMWFDKITKQTWRN